MTTTATRLHHILIIEDEGDMCLLLEILLQSRDLKISQARNLREAQLALKQEQPDLVLLDNRLPDGFGVDFISHIKTHYPAVKIIMITGIDRAAQDLALELGADAFLSKPFTQQQIHHSVDLLLN